jgi:hypothetical protein
MLQTFDAMKNAFFFLSLLHVLTLNSVAGEFNHPQKNTDARITKAINRHVITPVKGSVAEPYGALVTHCSVDCNGRVTVENVEGGTPSLRQYVIEKLHQIVLDHDLRGTRFSYRFVFLPSRAMR